MKKNGVKKGLRTISPLSAYVENVLKSDELHYEKDDEVPVFRFGVKGDTVDCDFVIQYNDDSEYICVYAIPEYKIPKGKIAQLLPKVNKLNLENPSACLRVDEEERLFSASALINTDGGITEPDLLRATLSQCYNKVFSNLDSLLEIIYGKDYSNLMLSPFSNTEEAQTC